MIHGTFTAYTNGKCRCQPCTLANRIHQQDRRYSRNSTRYVFTAAEREARRSCLICKVPIFTHPLKSCWRTV